MHLGISYKKVKKTLELVASYPNNFQLRQTEKIAQGLLKVFESF